MSDMTLSDQLLGLPDAIPGIVFLRHVWRQKADKLHACNQRCPISANGLEDSFAEVGQVIGCTMLVGSLTPDMASKKGCQK